MRAVAVADVPRGLSIPSAARFFTPSRRRPPPPPTPLPQPNHRSCHRPSLCASSTAPTRRSSAAVSTATSADAARQYMTDREKRRRRLDAALESLRSFRRWCSTQLQYRQQQQQHGHRKSTAGVATLADANNTSLFGTAAADVAVAAAPPPATLFPVEHRLLAYHATLLHAVQVAAMRASTADYRARYAPAVAAALLAPSSPTSSAHPFAIPRTARWAGERAVAAAAAAATSTDAVAQAERRLMHWSAQWHREVHAWHAKDRTNSAEAEEARDESRRAEDAGDALAQLPLLLLRGDWQAALRHLTSIPGTTTTMEKTATAATSSSHVPVKVLFAMASLRHRRRAWLKPQSPGAFPRLPRSWLVAAVTAVEKRLLRSPPSVGLRVEHEPTCCGNMTGGKTVEEVGTVRGETSSSSSSNTKGRSAYPSSQILRLRRRLWVLQHLPRTLPPSLIRFTEAKRGHRGGPLHYAAALPRPYMLRGDAVERLPWYPLCVLGQALELAAASTTQSAEHRSGDRLESEAADATVQRRELLCTARHQLSTALFFHDPPDYAALLDYVHLLFVSVGSTMVARHVATTNKRCGSGSGAQAVALEMERVLAETAIALLQPPAYTAYAAHAEVTLGEGVSDNTGCTKTTTAMTTATGHVDAPPPPLEWTALLGLVEEKDGAAAVQASTRDRSGNRTALHTPTDTPATRCVSAAVFDHICRCAQQRRNYHISLYCETLSQVCDGAGVAMKELGRVLSQQQQHALNAKVASAASSSLQVVVLAPESAAAITAAVLLQRLAQPPSAQVPADHVASTLFFVVPHAKAHAVASYFKGLYHPSFFQRVCADSSGAATSPSSTTSTTTTATTTTADGPALVLPADAWEDNAAARLVGRSMRRVDRYPSRTTEAFVAPYIRGDDVRHRGGEEEEREDTAGEERSHVAPPLMVDFYTVDLHAAVAHWRSRLEHRKSTVAAPTNAATAAAAVVIAAPPQLPYGLHAVYKPAEVTCTLHAHYPTLIYPLLSQQLPWQGGGGSTPQEKGKEGGEKIPAHAHSSSSPSSSSLLPLVVPVLHQQGLVNRIDVGTSGVVLATRDAASLHAANDAMVRCHQIRKTYRALVQRWPPLLTPLTPKGDGAFALSASQQLEKQQQQQQQRGKDLRAQRRAAERNIEVPLFSASPFLSSLTSALICAPVFAAGATAATIPPPSASSTERDSGAVASPRVASQQEGERYSRLHAALHDRRPALTRYRVLEWFPSTGVAHVQVGLESGRRHQIRQHFSQLGFPLVGDARYHAGVAEGRAGTCFGLRRAALHAYAVDLFVSPEDEEEAGRVVVQAPLPADMLRALQTLRALERSAKGPAA